MKTRTPEEMREYQRQRRQSAVTPDVTPTQNEVVTPEICNTQAVTPAPVVTPEIDLGVDHFGVKIRPRICTQCPGLRFSDLISHATHLATHNATPAQWTHAYNLMQDAKERSSTADKQAARQAAAQQG